VAGDPTILERVSRQRERVHISVGAVCNNNCIFCMEEDRDARCVTNSAMTEDRVRWILEQSRGAEEVCFTSGEPTTRAELPSFVALARSLGYPRISVMTNGRRLGHLPYAARLAKAGVSRFYLSIHGPTKELHDGLTRTPGSFEQTVAGLDAVASLRRSGVELHTSTVITTRNLPHLLGTYRFLRSRGVDQVVFNVMQANGRADTFFEQLFPRYRDIAAAFVTFLEQTGEERPAAFLVDIPLCTTEGVADFNRGYVEPYRHFDLATDAAIPGPGVPPGSEEVDAGHAKPPAPRLPPLAHSPSPESGEGEREARGKREGGRSQGLRGRPFPGPGPEARVQEGRGRGLVLVKRSDLDQAQRERREECCRCRYAGSCEGVWRNYLRRCGWDEFVPVTEGARVRTRP
jgi:cyclic pyranopterin phosphate synthase